MPVELAIAGAAAAVLALIFGPGLGVRAWRWFTSKKPVALPPTPEPKASIEREQPTRLSTSDYAQPQNIILQNVQYAEIHQNIYAQAGPAAAPSRTTAFGEPSQSQAEQPEVVSPVGQPPRGDRAALPQALLWGTDGSTLREVAQWASQVEAHASDEPLDLNTLEALFPQVVSALDRCVALSLQPTLAGSEAARLLIRLLHALQPFFATRGRWKEALHYGEAAYSALEFWTGGSPPSHPVFTSWGLAQDTPEWDAIARELYEHRARASRPQPSL